MAKVNNVVMDRIQGAVGKQVVFRVRRGKTFVSKHPDMSNVTPSPKQLAEKKRFAEAVRYAQEINNDPVKKAAYKNKVKRGQTVYHAAIKEYFKIHVRS